MKMDKLFANTCFDTIPLYKLRPGTDIYFFNAKGKHCYKRVHNQIETIVRIDHDSDQATVQKITDEGPKRNVWDLAACVLLPVKGKKPRNKR